MKEENFGFNGIRQLILQMAADANLSFPFDVNLWKEFLAVTL